jgi:hypothetical protein
MPLTAQQAFQQAVQLYSGAHLNPNAFQNSSWINDSLTEISNGQLGARWFWGSQSGFQAACGAPPANVNLAAQNGVLALSTAGVGVNIAQSLLKTTTALPVVGGIIAGVQALVGFIVAIFEHHKQAMARDAAFACHAWPAVNNAFQVINAALLNGQTTPQNASQALDTIYSQLMSAGGASSPTSIPGGGTAINDSPWCNGNCEGSVIVKAMVLYWQSQYAAIPALAQLPSTPAGYSPTPSNAIVLSPGLPIVPILTPLAVASTPAPAPALPFVAPAAPAAMPATPSTSASIAAQSGNGALLAIAAVVLVFLFLSGSGS